MVLTTNRPTTSGVSSTTRSASSTSSTTSSASSGCTSTVQRTRNIPIRIETAKRAPTSPSARRPTSTTRVQMNEFSVDFGGEEKTQQVAPSDVQPQPATSDARKSSTPTSSNAKTNRKTPPTDPSTSTARRLSATSAASSNGSGGSPGPRASPSTSANRADRQPSATSANGTTERRVSVHERRPSPSGSAGRSGTNGSSIPRSSIATERRVTPPTAQRKSASPAVGAEVTKSRTPPTPGNSGVKKSPSISKSSSPALDTRRGSGTSVTSRTSQKSTGSNAEVRSSPANAKRSSLGSIGRTNSINENTPIVPIAEPEVEDVEAARPQTLDVPTDADAVSTTATTGEIPDTRVEELESEVKAAEERETTSNPFDETKDEVDGDADVSATFTLPTTNPRANSSSEESADSRPTFEQPPSSTPSGSQIVPVEVHRDAEIDDILLEASATDDDMLSPTTDDEHPTSLAAAHSFSLGPPANVETASTTATTGGVTPDNEAETIEQLATAEAENSNEENSPSLTRIAYQSPTAELQIPVGDCCHEVSIDVNERRTEDGQLSTRIVLDGRSNAIAARDLQVEIRRKVRTELSPPVCTSVPPERKEADEPPVDVRSKSQPRLRVGSAVAASFDEPRVAEVKAERAEVEQKIEVAGPEKPNPVETTEFPPLEPNDEVRQVTPPIVPFVFKEARAASAGQFRDVGIRIESTPPTPAAISASEPPTDKSVGVEEKKEEEKPTVESQDSEAEEQVKVDGTIDEPKDDARGVSPVNAPVGESEAEDTKTADKSVEREATEEEKNSPLVETSTPDHETKSETPFEEIAVDVVERRPSTKDLAEVRVYRERYSEAPVLPYPGIISSPQATSDLPRAIKIQNARDELAQRSPNERPPTVNHVAGQQARLDLSGLKRQDESSTQKPTSPKSPRRPLISPVSPEEKQKVAEVKSKTTKIEEKRVTVDEKPKEVVPAPLRPQILEEGERDLSEVDETIERLKREPIRLNIARSLPQHSPPQLSSYEGVTQQTTNEITKPLNGYPSSIELNGLYRPHPLEVRQPKAQTPPFQSIASKAADSQQLNVTTTITTQTNLTTNVQDGTPSPVVSIRPSSRLSTGTGVRPESDFSPRTLSRINNLNVIMEKNDEKDVGEVIHHHPVFMRDTSKYWYKPTISREEAITMLKDKEPGTFVVRDSNSFPGAFGLALKVAQPPAGVPVADGTELVRHFLIEPSPKGVKLKGCSNEPVFGTLAALIYQHSITPMALPAKLILPDFDPAETPEHLNANQALLERGAACNVTYICSLDTESLTGPEAVRRGVASGLAQVPQRTLRAIPVHFKVSAQGITLTDNTRSLFFRRHYPVTTVTFAGIDPESRLFDNNNAFQLPNTYVRQAPMFGFVARKSPSALDNACHVFAELDPEQPASAVVRFITNVMMVQARAQQQQIHRATAGV